MPSLRATPWAMLSRTDPLYGCAESDDGADFARPGLVATGCCLRMSARWRDAHGVGDEDDLLPRRFVEAVDGGGKRRPDVRVVTHRSDHWW